MKYDKIINGYLDKKGWRIQENANFSYSYSGLQAQVADKIMAGWGISKMPTDIKKLHLNGDLHVHDLNSGNIIGYCSGGDLFKLLMKGCVSADVLSKPAKHFDTVLSHIVNYFFMSQLEWAGAQAFSDFNTVLSPFLYYDKISDKDLKQGMQRVIWDLNFASRQAFQTPFTNLTFNVSCPKGLENMPVIIGGEPQDKTYGDFQEEADKITIAFTDALMERDAIGRPFTFPIPTLNMTNHIDWDSELMEKIYEVSSDLGSFYFMNYIGSGINEDTVRSMCCRLNIDMSELNTPRGFWNFQGQTGSLAVVSLNMSRLGYLSRSIDEVKDRIDELIPPIIEFTDHKEQLIMESFKKGLMPFARFYEINWNTYFRTLGVIGLNELFINMNGGHILHNQSDAETIIAYLRDKTKEMQELTGKLWNLELIPGEGSSYRLAYIDRQKFKRRKKKIRTLGTKHKPYYSTLIVPPKYSINLLDRMQFESSILPLFTGGTIFRTYLGEDQIPMESMKVFFKKMVRTSIPYFDLTTTFGVCPSCHHTQRGSNNICGKCGDPIEIYSRVVGFYRPVSKWNIGKQKEFQDRRYYHLQEEV
jgi:ribonucleoside-triphosphate reductase